MKSLKRRIIEDLRLLAVSLCAATTMAAFEILIYFNPNAGFSQIALLAVISALAGLLAGVSVEDSSQKVAASVITPFFFLIIFSGVLLLPVSLGLLAGPSADLYTATVLQTEIFRFPFLFVAFFAACLASMFIAS